jgi:hypothetical protein
MRLSITAGRTTTVAIAALTLFAGGLTGADATHTAVYAGYNTSPERVLSDGSRLLLSQWINIDYANHRIRPYGEATKDNRDIVTVEPYAVVRSGDGTIQYLNGPVIKGQPTVTASGYLLSCPGLRGYSGRNFTAGYSGDGGIGGDGDFIGSHVWESAVQQTNCYH